MNPSFPAPRYTACYRSHCFRCGDEARLDECARLRYDYFVTTRHWVAPDPHLPGRERDRYDEHALHLGVWDAQGVAAYLRVLPFDAAVGFMLDRELSCLLSDSQRDALPREGTVEISRLVLRSDTICVGSSPSAMEMLLRLLYKQSKAHDFTRFYIVVEESWLRPFARRFGLKFQPIGKPTTFADGTKTVVATATMAEIEAGMYEHSRSKYDWYHEE